LDVDYVRVKMALLAQPVSIWCELRDAKTANALLLARLAAIVDVGMTKAARRKLRACIARQEKTARDLAALSDERVTNRTTDSQVDAPFIVQHLDEIKRWDTWNGTPPTRHELVCILRIFSASKEDATLYERIRLAQVRADAIEAEAGKAERSAGRAIKSYAATHKGGRIRT
jgi:hypothetical protein